jgi:hypothetical protein
LIPEHTTRLCPDCKREKPAADFRRNRARPDGLSHYCRDCFKVRDATSYRGRAEAKGVKVRPLRDVPLGFKWCPGCEVALPKAEFSKHRQQAGGHAGYCKPCRRAQGRKGYFLRKYGMTEVELSDRKEAQGGLCALCRLGRAEHVDHDHLTGKVRGVLCFNCNSGLGQFRDSIDLLARATDYLKDTRTWQKQRVTSGVFRLYLPLPASRRSATSSRWRRLSLHPDGSLQPAD